MVVTDNASGDDSVASSPPPSRDNGWSDWAPLQPLARNGGFAYGNNEAIRPALAGADKPDYVLLLNPDTLVRPGALSALVRVHGRAPATPASPAAGWSTRTARRSGRRSGSIRS